MKPEYLKIAGGTVHDPRNGVDGEVRDIWIEGGKIVSPPLDPDARPARTIDARGLVIMPGGVDMHCHIVGPKVDAGRLLSIEQTRTGSPTPRSASQRGGQMGAVPNTFTTGYRYAGLGYTTAFDAAIPPLFARHAHLELEDTPCIDRGFFTLAGNNHYLLNALKANEPARARAFLGWLIDSAKAYAIKVVNPGGVEAWKQGAQGNETDLDRPIDHFGVSPRQIVAAIAQAVDDLGLPHPVHIHANNLGVPGNWTTTLETMRLLEGRRGHLTHIQFHSYGGKDETDRGFRSRVEGLADYVNTHKNITVDVGQVLFDRTVSMTADSAVGQYLARLSGKPWISHDAELESGCGVSVVECRNTSLVNAWQWAAGLEWYLLVNDPWQVAMSTDHPNGGSFLAYPQVIELLMDRDARIRALAATPAAVREGSLLRDLDREYTLQEIAIITRAGPARMLGLEHKGHLGAGADADVAIYTPGPDRRVMFELPRVVIKGGQIIVENGEFRGAPDGETLHATADYDHAIEPSIERWFRDAYSVSLRNYAMRTPVAARRLS